VGSFVFSNGVVSAIPLIKDPSHLTAPLKPKLVTAMRKSLPIVVLGLVRVVLVKGTEYPVCFLCSLICIGRSYESNIDFQGTCFGIWHSLEFLYHVRFVTFTGGSFTSIHHKYSDFTSGVVGCCMYVLSGLRA